MGTSIWHISFSPMYHYTEAGLQNVWLENGYHVKKTKYGKAVSIEDAGGLNRAIGRKLACKSYLTGAEFRFLRKEMDLSQHRLADLLGTSEQTLALWEKRGKIPETASRMFRAIYLETVDGNDRLKDLIERVADFDCKPDKKMVFQGAEDGWLPKAARWTCGRSGQRGAKISQRLIWLGLRAGYLEPAASKILRIS